MILHIHPDEPLSFSQIFNLRRRTEHGALTHADGTINAMKFYDRRHLFTGAEDGRVSILKTGTWRVEKTLLKHQVIHSSVQLIELLKFRFNGFF